MLAAAAGIAKSVGDRQRNAVLNELLLCAIRLKMAFNRDDAGRLNALGMRTCVDVFRPSDEHFYAQSCTSGGTFARMWEKAHGVDHSRLCWQASEVKPSATSAWRPA